MKKKFFYLRMCLILGLVLFLSNVTETRADINESQNVYIPYDEVKGNLYFEPETGISAYSARATWQDAVKVRFLDAVENCNQTFSYVDLLDSATATDIIYYVNDLLYMYPNTFYISGLSSDGREIEFWYESEYMTNDVLNTSKVRSDMAKISEEVEAVLSGISDDMSELEKALYLHDWIVEQVDYAYDKLLIYEETGELPWWTQKAYSVFLYNETVCAGYAQCYSYLLSQVGLESYIVSADSLNHAWNLVKVDGAWYHVDCTWDDPVSYDSGDKNTPNANGDFWMEGLVRHKNFLRSDAGIISTGHEVGGAICWETDGLPAVSTTEPYANYFFMNEISPMYYVDGLWYYADVDGPYAGTAGKYTRGNYIAYNLITGNSGNANASLSNIVNMHMYKGKVYIATADKVYSTLPNTLGDNVVVADYSTKGRIVEFALKDGNLIVVYKNSQDGYSRELIDLSTPVEYTSIEIVQLPYKLQYDLGESLDTTGLHVNAMTSDGSWIPVENECTVTGFDANKIGKQTVTVTYAGLSASFEVEVWYTLKDADVSIDSVYTYTGSAIKPAPVVTCNGVTLKNGTDYTVSYSNNTKVGTASVTITGKGNYTGTVTKTFAIKAKTIENATVSNIANQTYTGSAIKPGVTVKDGSATLVNGTDYTVSYSNNIKVGTATVTITGKGNYTGTVTKTFAIKAKTIENATVSNIANQTYTGSAIKPSVTVKDGSATLVNGTDYTVSYSNNIKVGTATVTITGKGNYTGTVTTTFVISAKTIENATVSTIANQTYTGSAIEPVVTVKDGSVTLVNGTDYTVSYSNNTKVGTAIVTITGKGKYAGTVTTTFTINAKTIENTTVLKIADQKYTGSAIKPGITVKDGSTTLVNGTDYTVSYSNNIKVGTAIVTITGKGNYAGTKTITFKISAKTMENVTVSSIPNQTYTGSEIMPSVIVKDGKTTLINGTDYTVSYSNNVKVGTATVIIKGHDAYAGTVTVTFTIKAKTIKNTTVLKIADQKYTGSAIKPGVTVKDDGKLLVNGTDYTVSYSNNTKAGTATVTITGMGNYTGTRTTTFQIVVDSVTIQTGWVNDGGTWYYMNDLGEMQTGWVNDGGTWYYMNNSGTMQTGWVSDGGTWYYMNDSGEMQTGWVNDGGTWYYMNPSGAMATGWVCDGGAWYYMNPSGAMATGWIYDGAWYYMNPSGAMATGWVYDGAWYYMNPSGAMATGWVYTGGKWYYMYSSGVMATNTWIDGCRLDASGAWI